MSESTRTEAEAKAMKGMCRSCNGVGFTVEPECCGYPRVIWGESRHGEPEAIGEECCGSPDPTLVWCGVCHGTGKAGKSE